MTDEISCRKCGLELYDGEKICPNCGSRVLPFAKGSWFIWFTAISFAVYLVVRFT